MINNSSNITLKAIGIVRNEVRETPPASMRDWGSMISEIVVDTSLTEALDGLDEFSHIMVLYWMHRITDSEVPLKVHPRGRKDLPLVGLFATRTPNRPNRIGKTTVRLLERRGNILKVKGLDALDGSPVIDIKPCIPQDDLLSAKVPQWIKKQ
ncbi:MAG: tRNA (N6-threonylcarbamoyladenosine(37)-N6)-methyltransferase TrmO [Dehalococcoidales bacterium]|nr:tRNA (N6-threonylcarbamoyladenosine(37)-N6)-methyltransferase TrmO [Dehalococcoidales bacterium]